MTLREPVGAFSAILIALVPMTGGCAANSMTPCTANAASAMLVTVTDAQTGTPLEATVMVTEGNFQEKLNLQGITAAGQVMYGGAYERPGVYTVSVSRDGYETSIIKDIKVTKDRCHVVTRNVKVSLKRSASRK